MSLALQVPRRSLQRRVFPQHLTRNVMNVLIPPLQAGAGTQDWYIKLNDEDTVVVCTIIATAEYCIEVVGALGRSVAKTIDPPFGNKVRA